VNDALDEQDGPLVPVVDSRAQMETAVAQILKRQSLNGELRNGQQKHGEEENTFQALEVIEGKADERFFMTRDLAQLRGHYEEKIREKEKDMSRKLTELQATCERLSAEKEELATKILEFEERCQQLNLEKTAMNGTVEEAKASFERKLAEEKLEMSRQTGNFYAECGKMVEANKEEMVKQMSESRAERERLEKEKEQIQQEMEEFRADSKRKLQEEEEDMLKRMHEMHQECEQKVEAEKAAADRRLAEGRQQTEEQLRTERQITNQIMHVLRELPPLQTAMELGDLSLLEKECTKWRDVLPERFGECKGVVEAVIKLARERLVTWREVEHTWKDVLREVERTPGNVAALTQQSQRIFRVLKEAQLTKMDLRRSDASSMEKICDVLIQWQERTMTQSNTVQRLMVRKVVMCPRLGPFDFTDLDICLRLVDRPEGTSDVFLARAQAVVEDEETAPKDLRPMLSHIETILFFLKYTQSEDIALTHQEFRKQAKNDPAVQSYIRWAEQEFRPGGELVRLAPGKNLVSGTDLAVVLDELRRSKGGDNSGVTPFREIFYQWAVCMRRKFNLLVLPHHTQVMCLLIFRRFMEMTQASDSIASLAKSSILAAFRVTQAEAQAGKPPHTLIAQVGTGEGKSMIIAALAIYVVAMLRKKVHVVVDDETLLERDFDTFKRVFDAFQVVDADGTKRHIHATLCVSEEKLASRGEDAFLCPRVDPSADICYCEAKHVQSFYASIARGGNCDFDGYNDRVLILDEVDALVIDEEPNEAFVYPNRNLSEMATTVAECLQQGGSPKELSIIKGSSHPAAMRVVHEMTKEWARGKQMAEGRDFVYTKEVGKYCTLHAGRANPTAWSLALECRNFQDGWCHEILFQERLFVMSRPRVFRRYGRILGLSGSIGSGPERDFLRDTYHASFFEVPPFLKTCRGSPWHEAAPVSVGEARQPVYIERTNEAQLARLADIVMDARERVPVLIIAKDRASADSLVEKLRHIVKSRGHGAQSLDIVRSLSRTLYEADPEQWKENLNRSTLPLGDNDAKCWRITVTDPRGGRGTDYRVDDQSVDANGGLLLVSTWVPTSRREWTQFLGRTARQDCHGQYCCILNTNDYKALATKYKQTLPSFGGLDIVESILTWGDRDTSERIQKSAALYNCGVRVNELCEEVFSRRSDFLTEPEARERLVDVCQRLRWMSVKEIDAAFGALTGFDPASVPSEAQDLGRPCEPAQASANERAMQSTVDALGKATQTKVVIFCLDWSASMASRDTRTPLSRFETCVQCVQRILREQVNDRDHVGIVAFGPTVQTIVPPTPKGLFGNMLHQRITTLRPQASGGTCFYDAMVHCLDLLNQPGLDPQASRWLVCLTDGDDLGSRPSNTRGEHVTQKLESRSTTSHLNMIVITVGSLKALNLQIIDGWAEKVSAAGGNGRHLSEKDAAAITRAFDVVAEYLAADLGGAVEC